MQLIERLDDIGGRWNVLDHPFYRRWERGDLTRGELTLYAGEYRHAVVALAGAAAATGDAAHAREEAEHVALWDEFAAALDAPRPRKPHANTVACAEAWRRSDALEARAVLYAVESAQPAISRTKLAGLVTHYGFEADSPATAYFRIHASLDEEHAAASRRILESNANEEDGARLAAAAETALRGNWLLLDGVSAAA
jgi:pyrroloquinoline-quinone synthase